MTDELDRPTELRQAIFERLTQGQPLPVAIEELAIAGYALADIHVAVEEAYAYFGDQSARDHDIEKGKAITRLELLFTKSLNIQDYKAALGPVRELNKLLGLYPGEKPSKPLKPTEPPKEDDPIDSSIDRLLD
jgi:hypothetical protein